MHRKGERAKGATGRETEKVIGERREREREREKRERERGGNSMNPVTSQICGERKTIHKKGGRR